MTESEITVRKVAYALPVTVLGTDEQGRTLVVCPSPGCGEPAYIADDGQVVCTQAVLVGLSLADAMDRFTRTADPT